MSTGRESERETLQAMFSAAVVAQCAGESVVSTSRLAASLLRTGSVQQFCVQTNLPLERIALAADDPRSPSYDDCLVQAKKRLDDTGIEFGSDAHRTSLMLRPLAPAIQRVLDPLVERHGRIAVSPLQLLRDLIASDPELADRLRPFRLDPRAD